MKQLALKIDVDTARGTAVGVPNLLALLEKHQAKGTFLFSVGPDNTGRAIRRIFRPGFFQKVQRTSVVQVYGIRTLLNGLLWKGPHIGRNYGSIMRQAHQSGHEIGVHCYDHVFWQDNLHKLSEARVREEVNKAYRTFVDCVEIVPKTFGAAGWQASRYSLAAYDDLALVYASDTRGKEPFFPVVDHRTFKTLQVPTTLPTLDELLGRPDFPLDTLINFYMGQISETSLNVLTIHAELEGMAYLEWFDAFLEQCSFQNIQVISLADVAHQCLSDRKKIPCLHMIQGAVDGRSGKLAIQGKYTKK